MIPISDNLPNRHFPVTTLFLIGLMVALFIGELKLEATGQLSEFFESWALTPAQLKVVANNAISHGNPAALLFLIFISTRSLFASIFLHSSFSQILGNLLFLWVFGKRVEEILKPARFLGLYIVSGFLVGFVYLFLQPEVSTFVLGSTGSIAAILGAYLVSFPALKIEGIIPLILVYIPIELPMFFYLISWMIQQRIYQFGLLSVDNGFYLDEMSHWLPNLGLMIGAILVPFLVKQKPLTALY
jgi:membrane associated rhomboid family serine protease